MWWVLGGVLCWVVLSVPIAILVGRAIAQRDRAEFDARNRAWAEGVAQSIADEQDIAPRRSQIDRRHPPLAG